MTYSENGIRLTHITTGLSATVWAQHWMRRAWRGPCHNLALALLRAKLAKLREDPSWVEGRGRLIRSYHLDCPLGIPLHVRSHPDGDVIPIDGKLSELLDRVILERRRLCASP